MADANGHGGAMHRSRVLCSHTLFCGFWARSQYEARGRSLRHHPPACHLECANDAKPLRAHPLLTRMHAVHAVPAFRPSTPAGHQGLLADACTPHHAIHAAAPRDCTRSICCQSPIYLFIYLLTRLRRPWRRRGCGGTARTRSPQRWRPRGARAARGAL